MSVDQWECHGIEDVSCICKSGQCKISSACGTRGAFFYTACSSCSEDGCEDEGACQWTNGRCVDKPAPGPNPTIPDNSCTSWEDCRNPGKECHGIEDVSCICKRGQCKISSACGTRGAFFYTACSSCSEDGCEDEGACQWTNGRCVDKPAPGPNPTIPEIISGRLQQCRTLEGKACQFPFRYLGETFNSCTTFDSKNGAAWCTDIDGKYRDCAPPCGNTGPDNSCTSWEDCRNPGKECHGIEDVSCICKNGQCKISSECGTRGAFSYKACSSCTVEGCEDEWVCQWTNGRCVDKQAPNEGTCGKRCTFDSQCTDGCKNCVNG